MRDLRKNPCCADIQIFNNNANLVVSKNVIDSDFFVKGFYFTILTDDEVVFICKISEDKRGMQVIHSLQERSFYEYIRNRIGVADGALITVADLHNYGRTDVEFYKLDNENYYMDFSVR